MSRSRSGLGRIVVLVTTLILLTTCGKDSPTKSSEPEQPPTPPTPVATKVEITPAEATLNAIGQTVQLTARVLDQNNQLMTGAALSWTSSAVSVATVSAQGLVTAVMNGAAIITARSGNASATVNVTVAQTTASIVIEPDMVSLMSIGQTAQLTATVRDGNGQPVADAAVTWQSSDESVATVDAQGLVTAVMNGAAIITARSGNASATVNVTVAQTTASIVIEPDMVSLMSIGQTAQLTATVRDGNGQPVADAAVTWQSSDESVATVSAQGLVTAVKYGLAVITARSGNASATVNVTVVQSARSIAIEPREATIAYIGETVQLTVTVLDQDGQPFEDAMVSWMSSDESVAVVDAQGLVTAVMSGAARITARLGDLEDSIWVIVEDIIPRTERDVLVALYHRMAGPEWNNNTNWLSERPIGDWNGVSTNAFGVVIDLSLPDNGLKGTLPAQLAQLTGLTALTLQDNQLTGEIPAELGLLSGLNRLDLGNNNLTGGIPAELGDLGRLFHLDLSRNNLTGVIPAELGKVSTLGDVLSEFGAGPVVNLRSNQLSGPIPPELGDLIKVDFLDLSNNQLTGDIPAELGQLSEASVLNLSGNQLSGGIPTEFGNLADVMTLRFDNNPALSGPVPLSMITLERLVNLYLHQTQLCVPSVLEEWVGSIEDATFNFCATQSLDRDALIAFYHAAGGENWTKNDNWLSSRPMDQWFGVSIDADGRVERINLEGNNLSGTVSPALARLAYLKSLDLGENPSLAGPLPLELSDLPLERVRVTGTEVCAPSDEAFLDWLMALPEGSDVAHCDRFIETERNVLIELYHATDGPNWNYSRNWLTDLPVENWIGVTTDKTGRVTTLNLNSAGLKGTLPAGLDRLTRLEILALENSELTGTIPPEIGNLVNLTEIRFWGNQLSGEIPPEIGKLNKLAILDLSFNRLTGEIPSEIGQLTGLRVLQAEDNRLTGNIPPEIGQLRNLAILQLYDNMLTGEIPPEIGNLNALRTLQLGDNQLVGEIPAEIGQLGSLRKLALYDNQLTDEIPPEIARLGDLTELTISGTQLSGPIPPALGNLTKLKFLWLRRNRLSGEIPREIAQLANLKDLLLDTNQLTGAIPPELGDLGALENLWLFENQLTGAIPPELGRLGNLTRLILNNNQLTGHIPPEIGKLNALWLMHLDYNQLSGEIPPELGEMEQLYELKLSFNENMSGPVPIELTNNSGMRTLFLEGTQICAPDHAVFEAWLGNLEVVRVDRCSRPTGSRVYLTQATQTFDDYRVPLVAGEDALLRVFVVADEGVDADTPPVTASFYRDGAEIHRVDIAGGQRNIPSAIDEGSLSSSSNEIIPGSVIAPGLELVVEIDPEGTLDAALGVRSRIPETGRMPVNVRDVPGLDLTVVPLIWSENPDHGVVAETEGLTRDDDLFRPTRYLLPVLDTDFNVTVREPVFTSVEPIFANHNVLIREVESIRIIDGSYDYYMGVLRSYGGAVKPGTRGFVAYLHEGVIAHEIGHLMSLFHAPCGTIGDPHYPYSDGSVGTWGYDILENKLVSPDKSDVMSFCLDDFWISDYHFRRALVYRIRGEPTRLLPSYSPPSRVLLLWGGRNERDELVIEPSFVVHAPPHLPGEDGPYELAGHDEDGHTLFALNFAMGEIVHGEGGGSFAFAIPVRSDWPARLSRITLSGPEGSVEMTGDGGPAVALLRDQFTGKVRGFMRDEWTGPEPTVRAARRVAPEPGLSVEISSGIPALSDW